ncbi:MAG: carboxymuconolactone decarboxylase family protein [Bdellovibrio sp.]|nr:MAG: carboxymuconolactone decarboxylase family protein [Bdellovibrio sp.]
MNLKKIDPAFDILKEFAKATKGSPKDIQKMREKNIYSDGALPAKVKVIFSLLWSISTKCEPCIKYYAQKAKELGVTESEMGEAMAVASTMGGCVGEMWALKAFKAFHDENESSESCCV